MNATKREVQIVVEVLSVESCHALIGEALSSIRNEVKEGELIHDDGDLVRWKIIEKPVTF